MKKFGLLHRSLLYIVPSLGILAGLSLLCVVFWGQWKPDEDKTFLVANTAASQNKVLFLSAAYQNYEVAKTQVDGLRASLSPYGITVDVEYMDYRRYDTKESLDLFKQRLKYKIQNAEPYGAVIAGDDETLYFCENNQEELFSGIPVVFFGVDDYEHAFSASLNNMISGFAHIMDLSSDLDAALKINPELKRIVGVYDNSVTGTGYGKQFLSFANVHPEIEFISLNLSEHTRESFEEELRKIPEDSLVLHLYANTDMEGEKYTVADVVSIIAENTKNVPLFTTYEEGVRLGFLGGNVIDMYTMAKRAGNLAYEVMNGRKLIGVPLNTKVSSIFYVDYPKMQELGLNKSMFPANAHYFNMERTLWDMYSDVLIPTALIILSLIILLVESYIATKNSRKEKEKSDYLASHDLITGIPNRRAARTKLLKAIMEKKDFSFILIDIDDFKNINDFFSHVCGDLVLKIEGQRLEELMKDDPNYFVGRFGGDEFVIIYTGGFLDENSIEIYNIKSRLNEPVIYNGKKLFIKVSMGVVNSYQSIKTNEEIVTDADIALGVAKNSGKNNCVFFNKDMKKNAKRNDEVSKKLEVAVQNGEFNVLYQPQIDLSTGRIYGFEALTRLSDFSFPPSVFIPIAEEYGYISKLGRIVTEKVIKQMADWKSKGMELHQVAINFSSGQLGDLDYPFYLKGLLDKYDISPSLIEIEITESLFLGNSSYALDLFKIFEEIGVKLALDDFGTGYSSLNYLTYMPVDTVKIDKSMVDNYLVGEREESFIKNLSRLVHGLGMKLTVEGVEEKWQLDKLKMFHADYIQGYYYSKPISGDEVEKFKVPEAS